MLNPTLSDFEVQLSSNTHFLVFYLVRSRRYFFENEFDMQEISSGFRYGLDESP